MDYSELTRTEVDSPDPNYKRFEMKDPQGNIVGYEHEHVSPTPVQMPKVDGESFKPFDPTTVPPVTPAPVTPVNPQQPVTVTPPPADGGTPPAAAPTAPTGPTTPQG